MVAWSLKCNIFSMNLLDAGTHISHVQPIIFISSECPFYTLGVYKKNFQIIHHYKDFIGLQRSIDQQKGAI